MGDGRSDILERAMTSSYVGRCIYSTVPGVATCTVSRRGRGTSLPGPGGPGQLTSPPPAHGTLPSASGGTPAVQSSRSFNFVTALF